MDVPLQFSPSLSTEEKYKKRLQLKARGFVEVSPSVKPAEHQYSVTYYRIGNDGFSKGETRWVIEEGSG